MPSSSESLRGRLTWSVAVRTVATTVLLFAVGFQVWQVRRTEELASALGWWFVVVAGSYVFVIASSLLIRSGVDSAHTGWVQVAGDLSFAVSLVLLSEARYSPFWFVFLLAILEAALLLGRRGAIIASVAAISLSVVLGVGGVVFQGWVWREIALDFSVQLMAQLLVGALSAFLAEQLASTRGQLVESVEDLRRLSLLKEKLIESIPSGVLAADKDGTVSFVNPAGREILGLGPTQASPTLDVLLPGVRELVDNERAELTTSTSTGPVLLGIGITRLDDQGSLLAVFQDLTEVRRKEGELRRLNQLAELGRVSAELAHEVRNPLASMRGSAQLLLAEAAQGSHEQRLSQIILREADRLAQLVEHHLRLARPPPPQLRPTRLDTLAAETLEMLALEPSSRSRSITFRSEPVEALADPAQITQAIINLLRNALAVAAGGGLVELRVRPDDREALIEVWDSVGALSTQDVEHIFEPFFSRTHSGTGLGLSTVQSIVHAHAGRLKVESNPRDGTTFRVILPRAGVSP